MFSASKVLGISIFSLVIGLSITTALLYKRNLVLSEDVNRHSRNENAYRKDLQSYRDLNGKLNYEVYQVNDDLSNLKRSSESNYARYRKVIKDQGLKIKQIEGLISIKSSIDTVFTEPTLLFKKVIPDTCFTLGDSVLNTKVCMDSIKISASMHVSNVQDLLMPKTRETIKPPYKYAFFRFFQRKRDVWTLKIVNSNKYIKVNEAEWKIFSR